MTTYRVFIYTWSDHHLLYSESIDIEAIDSIHAGYAAERLAKESGLEFHIQGIVPAYRYNYAPSRNKSLYREADV